LRLLGVRVGILSRIPEELPNASQGPKNEPEWERSSETYVRQADRATVSRMTHFTKWKHNVS